MPKSHKFQGRPNELQSKVTDASENGSGRPFRTVPSQDHVVMEQQRTRSSCVLGSFVSLTRYV